MQAFQASFPTTLEVDGVESSYERACYGSIFYSLVRVLKPARVVELGTYLGYSALHMTAALRDNALPESDISMVDLWDEYPYRHCTMADTKAHFARNGLLDIAGCTVNFIQADARSAANLFDVGSVDLLHIDISNDGQKMADLVPLWEQRLSPSLNAMIVIEGGSAERDSIEWMSKYNKAKLRPWLEGKWVSEHFSWTTLDPFPSITMLKRR